jgi:hypothetical protein
LREKAPVSLACPNTGHAYEVSDPAFFLGFAAIRIKFGSRDTGSGIKENGGIHEIPLGEL